MINEKEVEELFKQGFDCGQIVLSCAAEKLDIDTDTAYKLAAGFGAGMFRGQTCGAVSGAVIALGMRYGHYQPASSDKKEQVKSKTLEFQKRFMEKYSSTACIDLLGHDISKPDELAVILEKGLLFNFCPRVVAGSVRILSEIL